MGSLDLGSKNILKLERGGFTFGQIAAECSLDLLYSQNKLMEIKGAENEARSCM